MRISRNNWWIHSNPNMLHMVYIGILMLLLHNHKMNRSTRNHSSRTSNCSTRTSSTLARQTKATNQDCCTNGCYSTSLHKHSKTDTHTCKSCGCTPMISISHFYILCTAGTAACFEKMLAGGHRTTRSVLQTGTCRKTFFCISCTLGLRLLKPHLTFKAFLLLNTHRIISWDIALYLGLSTFICIASAFYISFSHLKAIAYSNLSFRLKVYCSFKKGIQPARIYLFCILCIDASKRRKTYDRIRSLKPSQFQALPFRKSCRSKLPIFIFCPSFCSR